MTWQDDFTTFWNTEKPSTPWAPKFEKWWLAKQPVEPPPAPSPTGLSPIAPPVGPFTEIDGGGTIDTGVRLAKYELIDKNVRLISKVHAHHHDRNNIQAMAWYPVPGTTWHEALPVAPRLVVLDCIAHNALWPSRPKELDGTAEANFWIGCSAYVGRIEARRGNWMGMFVGGRTDRNGEGGCYGSLLEDMRLLEQRIGIYVEHVTRESTFRRFHIQASERGINVEYWYPAPSGKMQGSHSCVFEDGLIEIEGVKDNRAILLDAGTYGFTLRNLVIPRGVIELPNKRVVPELPNTVENCRRPDGTPLTVENGGVVYHDRAIGA